MPESVTSTDIQIDLQPQKAKPKPGKLFIGGEFVNAKDGKTFNTHYPATADVITSIAEAGVEDVDRAVKAARAAFTDGSPWRKMNAADRTRCLQKLADL